MIPLLLALRPIRLGHPRSVLAILIIAGILCVVHLLAGRTASVLAESQAVIQERLGHLTIAPSNMSFDGSVGRGGAFDATDARRIKRIVEASNGVALVTPKWSGSDTASNCDRNPAGFPLVRPQSLMSLETAQTMLCTPRTEGLAVFLSDPRQLDQRRAALLAILRGAGMHVVIHSWREQSTSFAKARNVFDRSFSYVAATAFSVMAASLAAAMSVNWFERRREVATLRALGMCKTRVFLMVVAEGLWMAGIGIAVSLVASGIIAWVVNRAAYSYVGGNWPRHTFMLIELDFDSIAMAAVAALGVVLLAALVPAFQAGCTETRLASGPRGKISE